MSKTQPSIPTTPQPTTITTAPTPTTITTAPPTTIKDKFMNMFSWMKMPYTKKGGRSSKRTRKNRKRGGYVIKRRANSKSNSRKGK